MTRIVALSDTHGLHNEVDVPGGDILIHAGDMCRWGSRDNVREFNSWLGTLDHDYKVVIAGNHDAALEKYPGLIPDLITNAIYLENSGVQILDQNIWGSPYTPTFGSWSFMRDDEDLEDVFCHIHPETDILVTHGPPWGRCDRTKRSENVGSFALKKYVDLVEPDVHIFGHVHESFGGANLYADGTKYLNVSICTLDYRPVRPCTVFDIDSNGNIEFVEGI